MPFLCCGPPPPKAKLLQKQRSLARLFGHFNPNTKTNPLANKTARPAGANSEERALETAEAVEMPAPSAEELAAAVARQHAEGGGA